MNQQEFLKICFLRAQFLETIPIKEYHSLRIQAFYVLSRIPLKLMKQCDNIQLVDMLSHVNWVFEEDPNFSVNPMPYFKLGIFGEKYYCAPGWMEKCTMHEISEAETAFTSSSNLQNIDKLYLLVAILYRPVRKDLKTFKKSEHYTGDIRETYNSQHVRDRIPLLKRKLPFHQVIAVFLFYWAFREKEIFGDPVIKSLFSGNEKKEGLDLGWLQTMLEVSNTKFGPFDTTIIQNYKLVMYELALQMDEAKQRAIKQEEAKIRSTF